MLVCSIPKLIPLKSAPINTQRSKSPDKPDIKLCPLSTNVLDLYFTWDTTTDNKKYLTSGQVARLILLK